MPVGGESTKWRMLRESFELAQRQSGTANPVLQFVKLALDPARELAAGDLRQTRAGVNEVLFLSGLELKPDGRLVPVRASRTADDARTLADRLKVTLRDRAVHPDVLRFCKPELVQRNYFHAVLEASKSVSAEIRDRTGLTADGTELADQAFTEGRHAASCFQLAADPVRAQRPFRIQAPQRAKFYGRKTWQR